MQRNKQIIRGAAGSLLSMLLFAGSAAPLRAQDSQSAPAHVKFYQGVSRTLAKPAISYDFSVWAYQGNLKWKDIDSSGETNYITADGAGNLYQLTDTNIVGIWIPSVGAWQALDSFGEGIISIFPNGQGTGLFEIRKDYSIWEWTGQWTESEGGVFQQISYPVSQKPDAQPYPTQVAASGTWITQLLSDGTVLIVTPGTVPSEEFWTQIDAGHSAQSIAQDGSETYESRFGGGIYGTSDNAVSWQMFDGPFHNASIAASNGNLYQLHGESSDRSVWKFTGTVSKPSWSEIDNQVGLQIVAAGSHLFELRQNGYILNFLGTLCSGSTCNGWQVLDTNPEAGQIAAGSGGVLYEFHAPVY